MSADPILDQLSATNVGDYASPQLPVDPGAYTNTFDPNGNLTGSVGGADNLTLAYQYNVHNQLISVTDGGTTPVSYADASYNPEGLRISSDWGNDEYNASSYLYDGTAILAQTETNYNSPSFYVWGPTGLVMTVAWNDPSYTFTFDPSGNNVGVHDQYNLAPQASNFYDAYGERIIGTTSQNMFDEIGYKGQFGCITDWNTNLVYCQQRYYSPVMAAWITRDPTGADGGMNVYEFCGNNPVMISDPSGLEGDWDWGQYFSDMWKFTKGMGKAALHLVVATVKGAVLNNPVNPLCWYGMIKSDYEMCSHPAATIEGIKQGALNFWGGLKGERGMEAQGDSFGDILGTVALIASGSAEAGGEYCVYQAVLEDGAPTYIGMTKNPVRRAMEHLRSPRGIAIKPIKGLERLTEADARAVEQVLIERNGISPNGTLTNKINSIAKSNPIYPGAIKRGNYLLKRAGY
jgi:RHS repeat-associated protein